MKNPMALASACALVLLVNAFILAGVAVNRSGQDARLNLTERELTLESSSNEDSSISLNLDVNAPDTLPVSQLKAMGYDTDSLLKGEWRSTPARKVYVALEMEGPAWRKWLADQQTQLALYRKKLQALQSRPGAKSDRKIILDEIKDTEDGLTTNSRLFTVEVGLDPTALRAAHPDRNQCAIVPGRLELYSTTDSNNKRTIGTSVYLLSNTLHVGRDWYPFFRRMKGTSKNKWSRLDGSQFKPWINRYRVQVIYGKKHEPWIAKCEPIPGSSPR